jgi:uncharacterized protein (DUF1015 family)
MIETGEFLIPKAEFLQTTPTFNYGPRNRVNTETFDVVLNSTLDEVARTFKEFIADKYEIQKGPFVYEQKRPNDSSKGIVCLISLNAYLDRKIKLHEKIYPKRAQLFAKYMEEVPCQVEPIVLVSEKPDLSQYLESVSFDEHFNREGVLHAFHSVDNIPFEFQNEEFLLTDGHHRLEALKLFAQNHPEIDVPILAFITNKESVQLYPYHREILLPPNGRKYVREFLDNERCFSIVEIPDELEENEVIIQLSYKDLVLVKFNVNNWDSTNSPVDRDLLQNILNISNAEKSENILSIPGERSIKTLSKMPLVENRIRIFYPHLNFQKFKAVAKANKTLSPKSTWIQPKMLSGLFIYEMK